MPRGAGVLPRPRSAAGKAPPAPAPPQPTPFARPGGGMSYAPYRRATRRRQEPARKQRPLELVVVLHVVISSLFLLGACTAMPAGVALLALQAQGWMTEHTIDLPTSGRLDAELP